MKKFIALLLVAVMVLGLCACKAPAKKYKIGICQLIKHDALDAATQGFMDAVKEAMGEDAVEFDLQNAAGDSNTCATIVNDFVSNDVDLIMANATPALQAAANATSDIPILGTSVTEYGVALGIENFNGLVGTNVSGTSDLAPLDKQAAMVKQWFPDAKNVGLLYCAAEANSKYQVDEVSKMLKQLGYTCTMYSFSDTNDLSAVAEKCNAESDVIYIPTDNAVANAASIVGGICTKPVIAGEGGVCKGCGVATLSINYYDLGVATGKMAVKILKGEAKVSDMKIEYVEESTLKYQYNKAICDKLGLKVPADYYEELK